MPALPTFVTSRIERLLFHSATVDSITDLSKRLRRIRLTGDALKSAKWIAGQKIQFNLGQLETRTYTPMSWDSKTGATEILAFLHGNGPASHWIARLSEGAVCHYMGPRGSLDFTADDHDSIFFGDETSIGAAIAHQRSSHSRRSAYIFEVSSAPEAEEVTRKLGLADAQFVEKVSDASHIGCVQELLLGVAQTLDGPHWVFTGNARSIQTIQKSLRSRQISLSKAKTKAYWAPGKKGLD